MKKLNFFLSVITLIFATSVALKATDSIAVTVYLDCRDFKNIKAVPKTADSAANAHNASQYASYDPSVMYITGHWSPPTAPGKGDWTFIKMDSIAPHIFKVKFKYGVGYFAGNTTDDADLKADNPGWYFAPTNDWSTNEWVPGPCNLAWDIQRIFKFNTKKLDTTVVFKYGVCTAQTLCSLGIPSICVANGVSKASTGTLSIVPNPASSAITVKSGNGISSVTISDITGKQILKIKLNGEKEANLNISSLPAQLYFIKVNCANGAAITSKLLKK